VIKIRTKQGQRLERLELELRRLSDEVARLAESIASQTERLTAIEARQGTIEEGLLEVRTQAERAIAFAGEHGDNFRKLADDLGALGGEVRRAEAQARSDAQQVAKATSALVERIEAIRSKRQRELAQP